MTEAPSVQAYLDGLPEATREAVALIRAIVHEQLPDATETIRYDIPTFQVDGRSVVHVAGWAKHVSLYPVPGGDDELTAVPAPYVAGRGTLKFPLDRPVPYDVVTRAVVALAQRDRSG